MRYVVTGGAGFIGSHIVEELAAKKHEVVIFDNLFSGKMENIAPFLESKEVTFVNGSVTDLSLLKKVFEGADGIFHEGAIASVPHSFRSTTRCQKKFTGLSPIAPPIFFSASTQPAQNKAVNSNWSGDSGKNN